jgi:hypothetical protein
MLSFPGEDTIRARAIDAHTEGGDEPESHHHRCPCHGMTEEEREAFPNYECECAELEDADAADDAAEARLDAMMERYD